MNLFSVEPITQHIMVYVINIIFLYVLAYNSSALRNKTTQQMIDHIVNNKPKHNKIKT